jgi:hypothetical protein
MRKKTMRRFLGLALVLLTSLVSFGKEVSPEVALSFARGFMEKIQSKGVVGSKLYHFQKVGDRTLTYVINFQPEGWVLLSADDRAQSIIAFSDKGNFDVKTVTSTPFYFWFNSYAKQVEYALNSKNEVKHPSWDLNYFTDTKVTDIEPIIKVEWNQSAGWNDYCPADPEGPGGHAYAGCVAVAMAQCMSVYKHPTHGFSSHGYTHSKYGYLFVDFSQQEYQWDLMPDKSANEHIAKLLFDLGVSVEMNYGADGSGAYSRNVPGAISKYFDYTSRAKMVSKGDYSDEDWRNLLIDELVAGRPVYYAGDGGDGQAGHAFCLDGLKNGEYFHFNWGWSGSYNGYFILSSLTPGSSNFSFNQEAVINFQPRNHDPYDIELTNNKVYEKRPAGEFVGKLNALDETPNDSHTFTLRGPIGIDGKPTSVPFEIKRDSLVTSQELFRNQIPIWEVIITATDLDGHTFEKNFLIEVLKETNTTAIYENIDDYINIYSNAYNNIIRFDSEDTGKGNIKIVDLMGRVVFESVFAKGVSPFELVVDKKSFSKGLHVVLLEFNNAKGAKKIMF